MNRKKLLSFVLPVVALTFIGIVLATTDNTFSGSMNATSAIDFSGGVYITTGSLDICVDTVTQPSGQDATQAMIFFANLSPYRVTTNLTGQVFTFNDEPRLSGNTEYLFMVNKSTAFWNRQFNNTPVLPEADVNLTWDRNVVSENNVWTNSTGLISGIKTITVIECPPLPPTINFVDPTPANDTNHSFNSIAVNLSIGNFTNIDTITIWLSNTTGRVSTNTSSFSPFFSNFTGLADGTYFINASINQTNAQKGLSENRTIRINTILPGSVTNLNSTAGANFISWNWTNPIDIDFNDTLVFIDGIFRGGTPNAFWNRTPLECSVTSTITLQTRDNSGNTNATNVSNTNTTNACPVLTEGLQLCYRMEENGGPYPDSSGKGHTGIAFGSPGQDAGIAAFGVDFDGTEQYINTSYNLTPVSGNGFGGPSTSWSISKWVQWDSLNGGRNSLWEARADGGPGVHAYLDDSGGGYVFRFSDSSGTLCNDGVIANTSVPATGGLAWNHLFWTYNGSHGKFYINGSLVNTTSQCGDGIYEDVLMLNRDVLGTGSAIESDGTFDELVVWNRSLGGTEAVTNFNNGFGLSCGEVNGTSVVVNGSFFNIGFPNGTTGGLSYDPVGTIVSFTWNDTQRGISEAYMNISVLNGTQWNLSWGSNLSTASNGTIKLNISTIANHSLVLANAFFTDPNRTYQKGSIVFVDNRVVVDNRQVINFELFKTDDAEEGLFWGVMIIGTLAMAGLFSPPVSIALMIFGVYITNKLGLVGMSLNVLWGIAILGMLAIWGLKS